MASSNGDTPSEAPMPIAIVGMSCRLSGEISTLDEFWTMLSRSRDGWRPIPEERYSAEAYYHPDPHKKGCFNQKGGYFMTGDMSTFDAPFFNITRQEAEAMGMCIDIMYACVYSRQLTFFC
jgi:acyl transferase domain-containing protein